MSAIEFSWEISGSGRYQLFEFITHLVNINSFEKNPFI